MTPEQLKASILQYAIQGKLVEQRPEEGTGEELYQQMQTDKQTLIREKKIKKEKPLPDIIDDEIPFDVPKSWKWVKVGNAGSWSSGATPSRTNPAYYGGSIPWLKTGDLNDGFIQEVPEYITDLALEKTSLRLNPIGSVLMAMYGATIGKLGILEIPVTTNQACCACIPYAGMNNKYLFYYLMSMRQSYIGMAEGGAQPNISKEKIVNSLIPLPPAEEQRRIVAKIEGLLPYVDRYAAAYEKLEQFNAKFPEDMKKSVLQYAIQGKLVEQREEEGTGEELYRQIQAEKKRLIKEGKIKKEKPLPEIAEDEIPFDIPGSWKWVRIGTVATILGGKRIPAGRKLSSNDTGYIYIRVSDMKDGYVSTENLQYVPEDIFPSISKYIIHKEDVFITVAGTIGRVGKIPPELDGANLTENADRLVFSLIDQDWLIKCMQSSLVQNQIADATTKVGQPKLAIIRIQNMLIPLPSLSEQKRIVAKLEEILPLCERLK